MVKLVKTADLYDCQVPYLKDLFDSCVYPWEMLPKIKDHILALIEAGLPEFTELKPGVWVGKDVKIADYVTIEAPAIIGHGTEIRPGAYIRGSVITGENCVLGNSSEFKNCILLDRVQCPHYNYVGDSILGYMSHMGAGSLTSNVKSDKTLVVVKNGSEQFPTGLKKFGAILGDYVEVGCNSVLNPGTVVGRNSNIYPTSCVRGVVPENSIWKTGGVVVAKK